LLPSLTIATRHQRHLRTQAGWGENAAFLTAIPTRAVTRWFIVDWKSAVRQPGEGKRRSTDMMNRLTASQCSKQRFTGKTLTLLPTGQCGMCGSTPWQHRAVTGAEQRGDQFRTARNSSAASAATEQ
jgi:hypothetical protein